MANVTTVWTETQVLTRDAPTLATEGVALTGRETGCRVVLSAAATRTLSGGGSLKCWYYDNSIGEWIRNPDLDITLSASHASVRRIAFPDQAIFVPNGRLLYAASGITVSAGTTCDVQIVVFR
jgi:hypothetical protein